MPSRHWSTDQSLTHLFQNISRLFQFPVVCGEVALCFAIFVWRPVLRVILRILTFRFARKLILPTDVELHWNSPTTDQTQTRIEEVRMKKCANWISGREVNAMEWTNGCASSLHIEGAEAASYDHRFAGVQTLLSSAWPVVAECLEDTFCFGQLLALGTDTWKWIRTETQDRSWIQWGYARFASSCIGRAKGYIIPSQVTTTKGKRWVSFQISFRTRVPTFWCR